MDGEDRFVEWLRRRLRRQGEDLLGDDAALLAGGEGWAISVDQQIEGVHYPAGLDARIVGRRLVGVCLSDLAASGAEPGYALLTVALPRDYPVKRLLAGVLSGCARHGLTLAGGDTATHSSTAVCGMTVLGRRPPRGRWLTRGGARAGDGLWLGGTVGESALGRLLLEAGAGVDGRSIRMPSRMRLSEPLKLSGRRAVRRHLDPRPQVELGRALGRRRRVAALDVSDGLAIDLHRLCRESGVGAELRLEALPVPAGLERWSSRLGTSVEELALGGGEDYVLLFTLPERAAPPADFGCARVGRITAGPGVRLITGGGRAPLPASGWDHLARG